MTSMEDDHQGKRLQWKTTSNEGKLKVRCLEKKTTSLKKKQTFDQCQGTDSILMTLNMISLFFQLTTFSKLKYSSNEILQYSLEHLSYFYIQQSTFMFITCSHAELDEVQGTINKTG